MNTMCLVFRTWLAGYFRSKGGSGKRFLVSKDRIGASSLEFLYRLFNFQEKSAIKHLLGFTTHNDITYSIYRSSVQSLPEIDDFKDVDVELPAKATSATGSGFEILFQGFNWESNKSGRWYIELQEKIDELAALGFTVVWLPPPTESISPEGYMPRDLYNLNSRYGNVEELKALVKKFHQAGIRVLGDAVINHR
ncbi:hypothetical protein LXL04_012577 [Taraxacum kok-saghyz]